MREINFMNDWYEIIQPTENISQGDILFNCPLFVPNYPSEDWGSVDFEHIDEKNLTTNIFRANVVIVNQACDLEVRKDKEQPKLNTVLVAILDDARYKEMGKNNLEKLIKLDKTELFLLDPTFGEICMGYQVVRFDHVISVPWKIINAYSHTHGPRLRLKSPYIQQLSQHFGNHFGRVAIPEDRQKLLEKYYAIKKEYEDRRIKGLFKKLWSQLSEREVFEFLIEFEKEQEK